MISICFLMLISIFALKFDYETLFQKRTIPQVELEEIKDLYAVNLYDTIAALIKQDVSLENGSEVIQLAQQVIRTQWKNYQRSSNYKVGGFTEFASKWLKFFLLKEQIAPKTIYQEGLLSKIEQKMNSIDIKLKKFLKVSEALHVAEQMMIASELFLEINSLNITLSSLITTHFKEAIAEKRGNDQLFHTSIYMLILLLGLVFFVSIIFSTFIIKHFIQLHNSLETKVLEKTRELRILNSSLEIRIKKEVENSRKKDQIMFQQARLASLGEMLQNIAHQWRQPLGALMMIVQSFQAKFISGKLNEAFIDSRVEDAQLLAKNMSETLEDFRTFFNPNKTQRKFNLKKVIEKSLELAKYQNEKEAIAVYFNFQEDIWVYGFENELIHVLLNLLNNSKDALIDEKVHEKKIWIVIKQTSTNALINVIDNAGGIKNDIMTKVFDPYFTTKHQSVGTGIGLYMSKQMIEKHMHGEIWCKNIKHKLGEDTQLYDCAMFTIKIPLTPQLGADNE